MLALVLIPLRRSGAFIAQPLGRGCNVFEQHGVKPNELGAGRGSRLIDPVPAEHRRLNLDIEPLSSVLDVLIPVPCGAEQPDHARRASGACALLPPSRR